MNLIHPLFAASSWPIAVILAVPVFIVLFGLAYFFAQTTLQRLSNLMLGTIGSIVTLFVSGWYIFNASRIPPLRQDDLIPIVIPTALAVGAAVGVALSVLLRKGFTLLFRRYAKEKASPQDSSNKT